MASETSDPGNQDTIDQMEEENAIAGMTAAQSQNQMSEAGLASGFGDYAGSSALSTQEKGLGSLTGSKLVDALMPGVGALSLISSLSGGYMQESLQRGGSPVYGSRGTVEGVVNTTNAFGTEFTTYSGNPDLDPNKQPDDNSNDASSQVARVNTNAIKKVVKAPTETSGSSYNPNGVVNASSASSSKRASRKGTILTSPQGDTTQLTTILKPGLKGTLG